MKSGNTPLEISTCFVLASKPFRPVWTVPSCSLPNPSKPHRSKRRALGEQVQLQVLKVQALNPSSPVQDPSLAGGGGGWVGVHKPSLVSGFRPLSIFSPLFFVLFFLVPLKVNQPTKVAQWIPPSFPFSFSPFKVDQPIKDSDAGSFLSPWKPTGRLFPATAGSSLAVSQAFAGSDVAGLRTTATLDASGENYVVRRGPGWGPFGGAFWGRFCVFSRGGAWHGVFDL